MIKKDIYQLKKGRTYQVIQPFFDYDGTHHPVGETWIFKETNYNAYHSGLTLHVWQKGEDKVYRFLDYPGDDVIIKECMDYVKWLEEVPPFYFEPEGK